MTGVEAGRDSNALKNRGGHPMEGLVEAYLKKSGVEYYREMYLSEIEQKWNISLQYRGYKQGRGLF
ncbi:MAG: type II restriction endonuclease [Fretibacterium sp.]|nr:type II restriction endonuclease [Fretibacterium sp.]